MEVETPAGGRVPSHRPSDLSAPPRGGTYDPLMAHAPQPPGRLTRRGFLRLGGATAALAGLTQIRVIPPAANAAAAATTTGSRFFDAQETEILTQLVERLVETGEPDAPAVRETGTVATIDALCRTLDPELTSVLPTALRLFEWGPVLFDWRLSRFTRLDDAGKDASLHGWMTSRLPARRQGFLAIRNLALLGYYSQPETWPLIGYAGPLISPAELGR